jgi:acetyl-CoA carboxylase biotin carboxyl carrier protein
MSDQEAIAAAAQPSGEERPQQQQQQKTNQPERERGHRDRGRRRHPQQNQPQQQQQQRRPEPSLNLDELRELVELIAQHGFTDFELEREGIRVRLRREAASQAPAPPVALAPTVHAPVQHASAAPPAQPVAETPSVPAPSTAQPAAEAVKAADVEEELHLITSPIVGTFYRSPSPQSEAFVRLGSHVHPDTVVCIIEAMKLMNEIQADTSGEIAKIYVENGQPVEYGQPLFGIKK